LGVVAVNDASLIDRNVMQIRVTQIEKKLEPVQRRVIWVHPVAASLQLRSDTEPVAEAELARIPTTAPGGENHIQHAIVSRISSFLVELTTEVSCRRHRNALPEPAPSLSIGSLFSLPRIGPETDPAGWPVDMRGGRPDQDRIPLRSGPTPVAAT
jgi:hypothetical protein